VVGGGQGNEQAFVARRAVDFRADLVIRRFEERFAGGAGVADHRRAPGAGCFACVKVQDNSREMIRAKEKRSRLFGSSGEKGLQVFFVDFADEGATETPGLVLLERGVHDADRNGTGELVIRTLQGDDENGARLDARAEEQADAGGGDIGDLGDPRDIAARAENVSGGLQVEGVARRGTPVVHGRFLAGSCLERAIVRGHVSLAFETKRRVVKA
jgi:hypothetical protein